MQQPTRERRPTPPERERILIALAVALLLHLLGFAYLGPLVTRERAVTTPRPIELVDLQRESADRQGRTVDIPTSPDTRAPDKARFLAENNARAERETAARDRPLDYRQAAPRPSAPPAASTPEPEDLRLALDPEVAELFARPRPSRRIDPGDPSQRALLNEQAEAAAAPAPDHLPDIEEGDTTALNALFDPFAVFRNRLKQAVASNWRPREVMAARDPTGRIFGVRDRYTVLSVTLDDEGELVDVWIAQTSGLDFLDSEAISAFRRAEPFPNPPRDLVEDDRRIRFQFGFYLEMDSEPRVRVFRRAN